MAMDGDLIQLVNRLQDTFNAIGGDVVDLPQIVVVGSQSSGKSSVLETIVGRDFLPRGQGIVTRRPLVLQLVHTPSSEHKGQTLSDSGTDYAEFLHLSKRFTDFEEIRKEIENETFRVAGQNKGVSKLPIHLKIYGSGVLDLTLVDLPGLTKIPVGDQPTDIERQIRNLVTDYISKPNSVILAVSPANVDLANSDSLKLARSVDPRGLRTIGVLTKLDLMDAGTNASDILSGRVYPLKLGFIGIVNRSQQDINSNLPMADAMKNEEEFFSRHAAYRTMAHKCGTRYLAKTLNQVLMNHIREKLPDMKARLNTLMGQTQQELDAFGDATFLGEQHRGSLIINLMNNFARDFISAIDGTSLDISTKELCGGARIYYIFHDVFGRALESIDPANNLSTQDIRTAIRNSTGPRPSLFVPEVAFDLLVKPQIKLLEAPSLRCVELVYEELMRLLHTTSSPELLRYPRLHSRLVEVVSELLRERLGPTSAYTTSLISIQTAYINTNHPAFVAGSAEIAREGSQKQSQKHHMPPSSNGSRNDEDDEGSLELDMDEVMINGLTSGNPQREGRSVSSTVHDRGGKANASKTSPAAPGVNHNPSHAHRANHHSERSSSKRHEAPSASTSGQPQSGARDSFLNYFFGGQPGSENAGPSSVLGGMDGASGQFRAGGNGGRTDYLPDLSKGEGRLAGRRGLEGSGAAFDMKSLSKHLDPTPTNPEQPQLSAREEMETALIRSLISSYFSIVRQTIQDLVPKACMHLLVNFSRETIQSRLVTSLYKPDLFAELLYEDEALVNERTRVKALLDAYKEAFRVLSEVTNKS
ncbi:dynamin protein dnm1 [Mrakia frigida]|uniref:dynamin-related GTPase DNM1 n=1 Tax=Mrakia frigida TaxID=29902 RepID=UPI003FCC0CF9